MAERSASSTLLAAGLDGIEHQLGPGAPANVNVGHLSAAEVAAAGIQFLPVGCRKRWTQWRMTRWSWRLLGPVIGPAFRKVKQAELGAYDLELRGWGRRSYLETL